MIKFGHSDWPIGFMALYNSMPTNSHAKRHLDELLNGIGSFKERVYKIIDGYQDYLRRKESDQESTVDRVYKG